MTFPILSEQPVPTQLKSLWAGVEAGTSTPADFQKKEESLLQGYREIWADALTLPEESELAPSLCLELGRLVGCDDMDEVKTRCQRAMLAMKADWESTVRPGDEKTVEEYYDKSENYSYELMWWHTLEEDNSPLAYVSALHLALKNGCSSALDFGAGVGAGSLLFARHGATISLADISSTLLDFSRRRLAARGIPATFIDLKTESLPKNAYDFITAMDVFEHIAEPEKTAETLADSLKPGGILFGRFAAEEDDERPSHIARDFGPMFERLAQLGFTETWKDEWLWGHQAFRKADESKH
ncbi:MAG: class I SAM-dependent methyltransferase [Terrimicrobiaceae bacterium]